MTKTVPVPLDHLFKNDIFLHQIQQIVDVLIRLSCSKDRKESALPSFFIAEGRTYEVACKAIEEHRLRRSDKVYIWAEE